MNTDLKTDVEYQYNSTTNENSLLSINECKQYKLDRFELRNNIITSIKNLFSVTVGSCGRQHNFQSSKKLIL